MNIESSNTYNDFETMVVAVESGHRCGYVKIPKDHNLYELYYEDPQFESITVHGGVTFTDRIEDDWFIGFDCIHGGDAVDLTLVKDSLKEFYTKHQLEGLVWTQPMVETELEKLTEQLKEK